MSTLERRYRRALRMFPKSYRAVYEDEMLGVLLAASRPGQRRVHWRDAIDLARSAASARLSRLGRDERWGDAAAVVSLVAPLVLCIGMAATMVVGTALFVVWPAVVVAGLLGWRRLAASMAWMGSAALLFALPLSGFSVFLFGWNGAWLVLAVLASVALTWSAGARHGAEMLGTGRVIALIGGVALVSLAELNRFNFGMRYFGEGTFDGTWAAVQTSFFLVAGLALLGVGAFRTSTPAQWRASLLLVTPMALVAWSVFVDVQAVGFGLGLGPPSSTKSALSVLVPFGALCGVLAAGYVAGDVGTERASAAVSGWNGSSVSSGRCRW